MSVPETRKPQAFAADDPALVTEPVPEASADDDLGACACP